MSDKNVVTGLLKVLANSYALYLKTHNYHWNVTGMNFQSLHLMFEDQYNDLFVAMDDIAERLRALQEKVPSHKTLLENYSKISDANPNSDAKSMIKELCDDNQELIKILYDASHAAAKADDEVSEGLAIERLTVHEKTLWMLRATAD